MHKEKLVPALCKALGIDAHFHHQVIGVNKAQIKAEIKVLKAKRDEALKAKDSETFRGAMKQIHQLKNKLRKSTV
jgi:uncharacterized protein YpiB (UPF0302 family)